MCAAELSINMGYETCHNGEPESSEHTHTQSVHVGRVGVKLPEFCETSAAGWFVIIEAQFSLAGITNDTTQFFHAIAGLPATLVSRLSATVIAQQSFKELKQCILYLVEKSKPELFESLLGSQVLTGKPSICLAQMMRTAEKVGVGSEFVRHRFLQMLPSNVTPVLAAQSTLTLDQLGNLADELLALPSQQNTGSILQLQQNDRGPYRQRHGTSQMQQRNWQSSMGSSGQTQQHIHYSVRPFNANQRPKVCRAHIYYGPAARTCKSWCKWPTKSNCRMEPNSRPHSPALNSKMDALNLNGTH